MKRLIEFPSETGELILVEIEDAGLEGESRRGLPPTAFVERSRETFENSLRQAHPMTSAVVRNLLNATKAADHTPDEMQVEFGITLSSEAGAILAASGSNANYKVTMTWKKEPQNDS